MPVGNKINQLFFHSAMIIFADDDDDDDDADDDGNNNNTVLGFYIKYIKICENSNKAIII
jgi:hypothetical protein